MAVATKKIIMHAKDVEIPAGGVWLRGELHVPDRATGVVLFAHGGLMGAWNGVVRKLALLRPAQSERVPPI